MDEKIKEGKSLELSLIIPVFNYEFQLPSNINHVLQELRAGIYSFEIVLVNDGSTDRTAEKMEELSRGNPEVIIINNEQNRGKGYAVKAGMQKARGKYLFFTDVDLPYGIKPVLSGVKVLMETDVDIVLGSRDLPESEDILSYDRRRKLAKSVFSKIVNIFFRLGITDTQCGMKGFSRKAAEDIFSQVTTDGFGFDVEVLFLAGWKKYRIELLPVRLKHSASTTVSLANDSVKMLGSLVRIKMNSLLKKYQ